MAVKTTRELRHTPRSAQAYEPVGNGQPKGAATGSERPC
jgi:hypothetical protein